MSFYWLIVLPVGSFCAFLANYLIFLAKKPNIYHHESQFLEKVVSECPNLHKKFWPTFWLANGHLQTIYGGYSKSTVDVTYKREIYEVKAPNEKYLHGYVALDWAQSSYELTEQTPTVVIIHGLAGGSQERYVKNVVFKMLQRGWRVVVFNARGCGGNSLQTAQAYCGAYTDDLRQAILYIASRLPRSDLFAVGYSLGANILVKYLGEDGERSPLKGAVSVGNPFDLYHGSWIMHSSLFRRFTYSRVLAGFLARLFKQHAGVFEDSHLQDHLPKTFNARTLREFDANLTSKMFGFRTVNEYYREASSSRYVLDVRRPLLCLSALDDPICDQAVIPYEECMANEKVILVTTETGGHSMDFFEGNCEPRSWGAELAAQFLCSIQHNHAFVRPPLAALYSSPATSTPSGAPMAQTYTLNSEYWRPSFPKKDPFDERTTSKDQEAELEERKREEEERAVARRSQQERARKLEDERALATQLDMLNKMTQQLSQLTEMTRFDEVLYGWQQQIRDLSNHVAYLEDQISKHDQDRQNHLVEQSDSLNCSKIQFVMSQIAANL
eukprot:TRINITY_DN5920_c0_g1_i2.p1 TRINITY_DN5920_c0_g1~~TRINITY_DN5920_c0_g1_i2.p1  ORF type:complete len:555 (+),score=82.19 TRINITY_DN5920_c0_g1_i2:107-1771(+)